MDGVEVRRGGRGFLVWDGAGSRSLPGGSWVGGRGCDGQEVAALAFGRPSRQLLLPYGRRLRRLRRLVILRQAQDRSVPPGTANGWADSCAPLLYGQRLTGWKPVPPRTATAAGAGGANGWSRRGGGVVGGRGCAGQEAAALAFGRPSRQLLLPYGERRTRERSVGCAAIGVEVPFDSVLHCRTSLRTGSSASRPFGALWSG